MPTIIDSLLIEIGFDTTKLTEGQKKATEYLRKLESDATKHVKGTEKGVQDLINTFSALQNRLLAIGGLIAAGLGFNRLTQDITKLNSETGFLAQSIGVSAKELSNWENVGKTVGAQANEISQSFALIKRSMADLQLGKGSFLSEFSRTTHMQGQGPAVELFDAQGRQRSSSDILVDISRWYAAQKNKAVASRLMEQIGFGQGMINLLGLGPEELKKRLKAMEDLGPSEDQIKRFQEMTKAFGEFTALVDRLATIIVDKFTPGMTKVLNMINEWLGKVMKNDQSPPEAAGEGMSRLGMPELAPNQQRPSILQRGWNWMRGRGWRTPEERGEAPAAPGGGAGGVGAPAAGGAGSSSAPGAAPGGGTPSAPGAVGPGNSEFLRRERQGFMEQLQDPAVRQRVAGMALLEDARNPTSAVESLANRFGYVNSERAKQGLPPVTVDQMLSSGFYGPINRGQLPGAISRLENNPGLNSRMNEAIDRVGAGSNLIRGFTDQGLPSDPNGWRQPQMSLGTGNIFNDWNGGGRLGAGDYRNAAAYRERLQAGVAAEQAARNTESRFPTWLPGAQVRMAPGQQLWNSRGFGGASSALLRGGDTSTTNTNTSSTHIGEMNVTVPPGADPVAYGNGIRQELQRFDNVQQSNTGLQ